eukprot:TRINITY_DN3954_c0_g1_i11.p2 TRINITY_DN3954_c0_g1~~TRINITY_DN3954_c0_g1_i11.p2  ORF type:complete len:101 (+),score=1.03 TRINITY_DN3954_c0_g1_i11:741-1043(+)
MIHKLLIDYGDAFEQQWASKLRELLKSNSWHSSPNRVQAFSKDPKCCPIRNDDQSCDVIVTKTMRQGFTLRMLDRLGWKPQKSTPCPSISWLEPLGKYTG